MRSWSRTFATSRRRANDARLLTVNSGLLHDHNGDAYDTSRESTEASGQGWAIFVMDEKGNVYAGTHLFGVFHHSSFLGGAPARAAGEIIVEKAPRR